MTSDKTGPGTETRRTIPNDATRQLAAREEALWLGLVLGPKLPDKDAVAALGRVTPDMLWDERLAPLLEMAREHARRHGARMGRDALESILAQSRTGTEACRIQGLYDSVVSAAWGPVEDVPWLTGNIVSRAAKRDAFFAAREAAEALLTDTSCDMSAVRRLQAASDKAARSAAPAGGGLAPTPIGKIAGVGSGPDRWVVPGVIPRSGFTLLVADAKAGKSLLALDLAIAVAQGTKWLSTLDVLVRGPVLYLSLDQVVELSSDRARKLGADAGAPIHVLGAGGIDPIDSGGGQALRAYLDRMREGGTPIALICIDVWQKFGQGKETRANAYQADYRVLGMLGDISREYRTPCLLLHHTNRQGRVNGSTAYNAAADCTILVQKTPLSRPVESGDWRVFRRLTCDIESRWSGLEHLAIDCWGEKTDGPAEEGRAILVVSEQTAIVASESLRDGILTALTDVEDEGDALPVSDIVDLLGDLDRHDSHGAVKKALSRMCREGFVQRSGRGNYYLGHRGACALRMAPPPEWGRQPLNRGACHHVTNSDISLKDSALCGDKTGDTLVTSSPTASPSGPPDVTPSPAVTKDVTTYLAGGQVVSRVGDMVTRVGTLKSEPVRPQFVDDGFLSDEEWGGVNEATVTRDGTVPGGTT